MPRKIKNPAEPVEPDKEFPIDSMKNDLKTAGWFNTPPSKVWESPDGDVFTGPFSAWKALRDDKRRNGT